MKKTLFALLLGTSPLLLRAQDFYDIGTIQDIHLQFSQSNWDAILDSLSNANSPNRLVAQYIIINGVQFDSVGVKYKGNSSNQPNNTKNPFNIDLDYVINGQDYQGYDALKLSNVFKDPTFVREALGYEIARYYMPAPKANYARVYVNGNYHGLYTNVESVNGEFLDEHFANNDGVNFKCDPTSMSPLPIGCNNGGSALEYLGSDTACFYTRYELESDYGWTQLRDMTNSLKNNLAAIEQYLDVDRALWMLAFDNVLVNFDSYLGSGHNYYIYQDNNNRFNTIIWDCNETFGAFTNGGGGGGGLTLSQMQNLSSLHNQTQISRPLMNKLMQNPKYKKSYIAHLRTILEENFESGSYTTRIQTMQNLISADVQADNNKFYSFANFTANVNSTVSGICGITELMSSRITYLQSDAEVVKVPPVISSVIPSNSSPNIDDMVTINATITGEQAVKLRYRYDKFDVFVETDMFDDGTHNDGAANDNVYGAEVQVPVSGLQYYIYAENADAAMFSPVRAEYEFYELNAVNPNAVPYMDIVINEFMASNVSAVAEPNGDFGDWLEIYNNTAAPVSLNGVYLTDELSNEDKWAFPDTSIAANGYLIVWIDNDTVPGELHATFKLSASGEQLGLFNNDGTVIDTLTFGAQTADVSYGRYPNGTGSFTTMPTTFSAENSSGVGVNETPSVLDFVRLFPNPARNGYATLLALMQTETDAQWQVFDGLGRCLVSQECELQKGENQFQIDCRQWSTGVYFVRIAAASGEYKTLLLEVR